MWSNYLMKKKFTNTILISIKYFDDVQNWNHLGFQDLHYLYDLETSGIHPFMLLYCLTIGFVFGLSCLKYKLTFYPTLFVQWKGKKRKGTLATRQVTLEQKQI